MMILLLVAVGLGARRESRRWEMWDLDEDPSCIYDFKYLYIVKRALNFYK
jgi:hypothetical protein